MESSLSPTAVLGETDLSVTTSQILAMSVQCAADADLSDIRRCAETFLRLWRVEADQVHAVALCLSELFTNVVVHVPGSPCTVALRLTAALIRLTVRDSSLVVPTIPAEPQECLFGSPWGESKRGLCMVALYADRFRFDPVMSRFGHGKTAVAEWGEAA